MHSDLLLLRARVLTYEMGWDGRAGVVGAMILDYLCAELFMSELIVIFMSSYRFV